MDPVRHRALARIGIALGLALLVCSAPQVTAAASSDPYVRRVRAEFKVFADWLDANGAKGYMGEIGWPNNRPGDQSRYNALAETYILDMKAAGVKGAVWATGEWWGTSYALSAYIRSSGASSINARKPQANVVEKYTTTVGTHSNGGEFGAVYGTTQSSRFSNVKRGTYNTDWHYDKQASFNYLASRGVKEVVIPFRWERIQPQLNAALDSAELTRLKDAIGRVGAAGMKAVPMVANYGAYWLHDSSSGKGIRRAIGSSKVPVSSFADLWNRLSIALKNTSAISAYGLMREPAGLAGSSVRAQAVAWENASNAAVEAIRDNGDAEHLLVSGYRYSNAHTWPEQHPAKWVIDPLNNHSYEAHHYWASTYNASYKSYDNEVEAARAMGY
jgi:hypothetical protein